ncbi:MAG: (5-formylfuran-3-yl)methyl phosphate synthase [Gammaproteobacteria bacterium]|nr:(5-formylfuran-3-yl)methyl phosphate synthase [Gammaproteobacteria bacterium]
MTLMLASVTGPEEARLGLRHGADIIDLKDPDQGALGAIPLDRIHATVTLIGRRRRVSATVGDLPPVPAQIVAAVERTVPTGVDYIKIGLCGGGDWASCIHALKSQARSAQLIGVLFADQDPDLSLLTDMVSAGFLGAMLDTADKRAGGLTVHQHPRALHSFVTRAKELGLLVGLAGSLRVSDIRSLLALGPDYLGFRSALCDGGRRSGRLSPAAIHAVRKEIPRQTSASAAAATA